MGIVTVIAAAVCLLNLASCHPEESLSEEAWPETLMECFEEFKESNFNGFCSTFQDFKQTFYDAFYGWTGRTFQEFYQAFNEVTGTTFPDFYKAFNAVTGSTFPDFYKAFYEQTGSTFPDFYKAFYEQTGNGIADAEAAIFVMSLWEECSEATLEDMKPLFFTSFCMDQECASFGANLPSAEFSEYTTEMIMKEMIHSFCWTK